MNTLIKEINLTQHDDIYQMLVDLHDGKSLEESRKINAKLILLLMNQLGDVELIKAILELLQNKA